ILNGMTYMVRPRMQPSNNSSSVARIFAGGAQLLVGPASSWLNEQMKVRSSTRPYGNGKPDTRPYDLLPGIALIEELRSESLNPLSACHNFSLSLLHPLTQIKTRPPGGCTLYPARLGEFDESVAKSPGMKASPKAPGGRRPRLPSEVRAGAGFRSLRP